MITIALKTASIVAAVLIAPKSEARYCLNGVCIKVKGDGTVYVRATDGLTAFDDIQPDVLALDAPLEIIIPRDVAVLIAKNKNHVVALVQRDDGTCECAGQLFKPIDGRFPDVDRVFPAVDSQYRDVHANYDFDLLARGQAAMRKATGRTKGYFRLQNSPVGLLHCETETWPRVAVMPLSDKAFHA